MLTHFDNVCDGHYGSNCVLQPSVRLEKTATSAIHSASCPTATREIESENEEIDRVLVLDDVEPAQIHLGLSVCVRAGKHCAPLPNRLSKFECCVNTGLVSANSHS